MIYCVVPEALADELFDKLTSYYAGDHNVTVIVERRKADRRARGGQEAQDGDVQQQREVRDRRRARVPGDFPAVDTGGD